MAASGTVAPATFAIGTPVSIGGIFTNQPANDSLEVISSDAGDTTQHILIVGIDNSDAVQYESIALNGTSAVTSSDADWKTVQTCELDGACAGTVTVREASGNATIITLAPGVTYVADTLFAGFLENVKRRKTVESATPTNMSYDLDFVDVGQVLDRRVCLQDYADTTIAAILTDLFTDILTAEGFVSSWGGVSQVLAGDTNIENLNSAYKPVSDVLDELAQVAGCTWWMDPYRCLHMAASTDEQPSAPFALSESVPVRNLSLETAKGEYRNREYYVYDQIWSTTKTVHRRGDGKTGTFFVSPNIYSVAMDKVTVDSITRVVKPDSQKDIFVASQAGGQFGNAEWDAVAHDRLEAEADDPNDNRDVTVIYFSDSNTVVVETKALPTGTPNTVQFDNTNMKALCGVKLTNGDPGVGTEVVIRGTVGSPTITYVTITGSGTQSAGVKATGDTETYYVKPQISVTNDPTHADVRLCIISYTNEAGTPGQYQAVSLNTGVLTGTFGTVAKSVEEMYVGDFTASETVSLYCEAEYQYAVNSNSVRQSANGTVPADGYEVIIEYTPMWKSSVTEIDGGAISHSDMATLEGSGTGYYDHATIEKEPVLAAEAAIRAAALGDKYGDFPKQVYFETDTDWFFPGEKLTVNLADNFGEDGTTFVVTEVNMQERPDTQVEGYRFIYGIKAVYGEDFSAFDRIEIYRRLKQKARVWVPVNNITS